MSVAMGDATADIPPEIISEILLLVRDSFEPTSTIWQQATLVCSRWHEIALTTPLLWSRIHISRKFWSVEKLEAFLQRSANNSLDISCKFRESGAPERYALEALRPHAARIKSLELKSVASGRSDDIAQAFQPLVSALGPRLEFLSLHTNQSHLLLNTLLPTLRSLSVEGTTIQIDFPLPALTHLELRGPPFFYTQPELGVYLGTILQFCSSLETLVLVDMSSEEVIEEPTISVDPITLNLPRLRELTLYDDYSWLPAMVALLPVPPTVSLRLEARCRQWKGWVDEGYEDQIFLEMLRKHIYSLPTSPAFDKLILAVTVGRGLVLRLTVCSSPGNPQWTMVVRTDPSKPSNVDDRRVISEVLHELVAVGEILRPTELDIHIQCSKHDIPSEWSKLAAAYPQVQKLSYGCADPRSMNDFQQMLVDPTFRSLREITLCVTDWNDTTAKVTHKALRLRTEHGDRIKQLVVCPRSNDLESTTAVAVLDSMPCPFDLIIDLNGCAYCLQHVGTKEVRAFDGIYAVTRQS
ncbi:hypothetical protein C8Q76DRAFT_746444 [Earliella scabrosa]|nr:hypothetical protein C8Q76DRAFT_746444 [Earliella scabrosa]